MPKTGTTAIQTALDAHGALLLKHGLVHPKTEHCNTPAAIALFHPQGADHHHLRKRAIDRPKAASLATALWEQIQVAKGDVVLSCEYLFNIGAAAETVAQRFEEAGFTPVFVCYVRHPVDAAISAAQQSIKMGYRRLAETVKDPRWHNQKTALSAFVATGRDLVVRDFAEAKRNGAAQDFLSTLGYDALAREIPREQVNESLTMDGALLAEIRARFEQEYGYAPFQARLIFEIGGTKFTLPEKAKQAVRTTSREEVRWISETFGISLAESASEAQYYARLSPEAVLKLLHAQGKPGLVRRLIG
ncbi:sulfotransferase [Salipiger sp. P9]|nr:sulfotransferase [Salipiger pentaromativorans]